MSVTNRRIVPEGPEFYPTPRWATHALCNVETFTGEVWEPACGNGRMADVLSKRGNQVYASELYDRKYGEIGVDFLETTRQTQNIVMNPPYNLAEEFIWHGLKQIGEEGKLALLLRIAFLEGAARQKKLFREAPPARVWVFSERITFYPAGQHTGGSGTTAYAWFVWDKAVPPGKPEIGWIEAGTRDAWGWK